MIVISLCYIGTLCSIPRFPPLIRIWCGRLLFLSWLQEVEHSRTFFYFHLLLWGYENSTFVRNESCESVLEEVQGVDSGIRPVFPSAPSSFPTSGRKSWTSTVTETSFLWFWKSDTGFRGSMNNGRQECFFFFKKRKGWVTFVCRNHSRLPWVLNIPWNITESLLEQGRQSFSVTGQIVNIRLCGS